MKAASQVIALALFGLVLVVSTLELTGWIFLDIDIIASYRPTWEVMQPATAFGLICASVASIMIGWHRLEAGAAWSLCPRTHTAVTGLVMSGTLLPTLALFDALPTTDKVPDSPSPGTWVALMLILVCAGLHSFHTNARMLKQRISTVLQALVISVAGVALLGHAFDIPELYYYWTPHKGSTSVQTALMLLSMAVGFSLFYGSLGYIEALKLGLRALLAFCVVGFLIGLYVFTSQLRDELHQGLHRLDWKIESHLEELRRVAPPDGVHQLP